MILKIFKNINPKKTAVHTFVSETFYKIYNISKVEKYFLIYKNWLIVSTSSFHLRSNVIFSKKKCQDLPTTLNIITTLKRYC